MEHFLIRQSAFHMIKSTISFVLKRVKSKDCEITTRNLTVEHLTEQKQSKNSVRVYMVLWNNKINTYGLEQYSL